MNELKSNLVNLYYDSDQRVIDFTLPTNSLNDHISDIIIDNLELFSKDDLLTITAIEYEDLIKYPVLISDIFYNLDNQLKELIINEMNDLLEKISMLIDEF